MSDVSHPLQQGPSARQPTQLLARLVRSHAFADCTLGYLILRGRVWCTLEPPWANNKTNESCIPSGTFEVSFLPRSASGRYRNVYRLDNVPGRGGILIHCGNTPRHTKGCILIGSRLGKIGSRPAVLNYRTALAELRRLTASKPFKMNIHGDHT